MLFWDPMSAANKMEKKVHLASHPPLMNAKQAAEARAKREKKSG